MFEIILFVLLCLSTIIGTFITARNHDLEELLEKQYLEIKQLKEFKRTHSKCTDKVCIEKVLDDIIGDM